MPPSVVSENNLVSDLKFDSLSKKELLEKLSDEFCLALDEKAAQGFGTVKAVIDYFSAQPKAR